MNQPTDHHDHGGGGVVHSRPKKVEHPQIRCDDDDDDDDDDNNNENNNENLSLIHI